MKNNILLGMFSFFVLACATTNGKDDNIKYIDPLEMVAPSENQKAMIAYNKGTDENDVVLGKPLIVLWVTNPWLMVIGSDSPKFVLYENGRVVMKNNETSIFSKLMNKNEIQELINYFEIYNKFYDLDKHLFIGSATDQPNHIIYLDINNNPKVVNVYGSLQENGRDRKNTPKEFLLLYDKIINYKIEVAEEWLPPKIEILFWDYNYAPNKKPWINGFPDLYSPDTKKRGHDSYSVFIDNEKYKEFLEYFKNLGEKEAVEINGRKMAISFRFPFPQVDDLFKSLW